ncbi:MAG TPA: SDR family NAD(P)-dependent oxidoreductase [Micromonospora sp.]
MSGGRSVVVTGANKGIGLVTVLELARAGFTVFGTTTSEEKADGLRETAARAGLQVQTAVCDVSDAAATEEAFGKIAAATGGGPWAVVNNAGFAQGGAIEDVTDEQARHQLEVNLVAPARIARLVLPSMRQRGDGRIVNVSSSGGKVSEPLLGWYNGSKFALESISDSLRMEVGQFGVKVVLIEPGGFSSGIWDRGVNELPSPENSAYSYAFVDELPEYVNGLPSPEPVARTVRKALTVAKPKPRYLVGADAKAIVALDAMLPDRVMDWMKSVRFGLLTPQTVPGRITAKVLAKLF